MAAYEDTKILFSLSGISSFSKIRAIIWSLIMKHDPPHDVTRRVPARERAGENIKIN